MAVGLNLTSTPNDRLFEKLFTAILFTLIVYARNLLRGNCRGSTFRILFWCLAWGSNSGFTSNKPTHYLLEYGDFLAELWRLNIKNITHVIRMSTDHSCQIAKVSNRQILENKNCQNRLGVHGNCKKIVVKDKYIN